MRMHNAFSVLSERFSSEVGLLVRTVSRSHCWRLGARRLSSICACLDQCRRIVINRNENRNPDTRRHTRSRLVRLCAVMSRFRRSMHEKPILIIEHQHAFRWIYCQFTIALVRQKPDRFAADSVVARSCVRVRWCGLGWLSEVRLCDPVPACVVC